jgi:long-chain acyl-CoA synthetase
VILTHGNLLSNALACSEVQPHRAEDVILSWLPYTHIYARTVDHYSALVDGTTLALSASGEAVVADLADVRPTHMAAVPRFYEKLLAAYAHMTPEQRAKKLRAVFGGRIDWISSGGAPLPNAVAEEYHAAGIQLMQGYGLTETSPVISFNKPGAHKLGTVGRAIPGVEIRISEDGEVLTKGPHVMRGYWREEEATARTIRDGWLHTGDLGTIDEDGYLSITGRKKELMVLSNGKKVVPTYLEGLLCNDAFIDQAVVAGEGRNFLVALIVPKWDKVREELKLERPAEDLVCSSSVKQLLLARCYEALRDLSHMEQIKKVLVMPRPFSVVADEVTVSLKLRRGVVLQKHAEALEKLYHGEE